MHRQLIEDGIALDRKARTTTFDKLLAPVQQRFRDTGMTEQDLDALVDSARSRHHRSGGNANFPRTKRTDTDKQVLGVLAFISTAIRQSRPDQTT